MQQLSLLLSVPSTDSRMSARCQAHRSVTEDEMDQNGQGCCPDISGRGPISPLWLTDAVDY